MTLAIKARRLANFIEKLESFETVTSNNNEGYNHIGALFTDIILQAGLNYRTVVRPRVDKLLITYPDSTTLEEFHYLIQTVGLKNLIRWDHSEKLNRLSNLIEFALENNINTCQDFRTFLKSQINQEKLRELRGFGPKTIDYTLKLLNFDTVAVDRHILSFVAMADISINGYATTKKIVEYAADFMQVSRSTIDYSIWLYMSNQPNRNQVTIDF